MTRQRLLLALSVVAGLVAGGLYYVSAQRLPVVVVARDLEVLRPLDEADVSVRSFPADAVPPGAMSDARAVLGRYPRMPLGAAQILLAGALADDAAIFQSGLGAPPGQRAIGLPVSATGALGGAVAPGVRVDVIAVPVMGKAPAGRPTELIASRALVLDVRTESSAPLPRSASRAAFAERIGSVVVAVPASDELRIADRVASSTFVLVLAPR